jgi:hypothetical protein
MMIAGNLNDPPLSSSQKRGRVIKNKEKREKVQHTLQI